MSRTTISVTDEAHARADATRADGESWTEWVERATDALEDEGENTDDEVEPVDVGELFREALNACKTHSVAAENVDEIARATADEVENRMTRR